MYTGIIESGDRNQSDVITRVVRDKTEVALENLIL
jgi:hypothetical protein